MASLFERFKGRREPTSAEIAKERLKLLLVTDRSDLTQDKLSDMQAEIIEVIRRYIPIDAMDVQIKIEQRERKNYLVADIPLHREHGYQPPEGAEPPEHMALSVEISASDRAPAESPASESEPWTDEPDSDED